MKRPGWSTIVGIMMILFGGCGATNDFKQIYTPALMEFQKDLVIELESETDITELDSSELAMLEKLSGLDKENQEDTTQVTVADHIKSMTSIPPVALSKLVMHGYIGIVISVLYALAGLLLFFKRRHVLKFAVTMLVISLIFVVYQAIDIRGFEISRLLKMGLEFNIYFGAFLDVVLLIILAFVDKSYFRQKEQLGDYYDELPTA